MINLPDPSLIDRRKKVEVPDSYKSRNALIKGEKTLM
jgi:hypothetical protein